MKYPLQCWLEIYSKAGRIFMQLCLDFKYHYFIKCAHHHSILKFRIRVFIIIIINISSSSSLFSLRQKSRAIYMVKKIVFREKCKPCYQIISNIRKLAIQYQTYSMTSEVLITLMCLCLEEVEDGLGNAILYGYPGN